MLEHLKQICKDAEYDIPFVVQDDHGLGLVAITKDTRIRKVLLYKPDNRDVLPHLTLSRPDMEFIATFNPSLVTKLLTVVEAVMETYPDEADRIEKALDYLKSEGPYEA